MTGGRRVLLVHPSAELYGSDRVAVESAAGLHEAGWQVVAALSAQGPLREVMQDAGATVVTTAVPVLRKSLLSVRGLVGFLVANLRAVRPTLALLREHRPDVVYVSTVTIPLWLLLARLTGRRVVAHVHEAEEGQPRVVRMALAAPLLLAHTVIANSELSRQVVVKDLGLLARRTHVIYNGVPGPTAPGPAAPEPHRPVRLVLVGRVSPRKGTDVAVTALALLRRRGVDAQLTLVGGIFGGYEWFERQVRAEAAAAGVGDHVHWTGVLPQIWDSLAQADIALVPSRVEPFGNAAVEAMLARRPVVAGNTQGLREIVVPGRNGELAEPGDPASLADAVERLLADWPAAVARAETAAAQARERFAPQRYRDDVVRTIETLAIPHPTKEPLR